MKQHSPSVAGIPIVYWKGDKVTTKDGRIGTVLDYEWNNDLVIYDQDGIPSRGFFIVEVDFGDYTEKFLKHDLSGDRIQTDNLNSEYKKNI